MSTPACALLRLVTQDTLDQNALLSVLLAIIGLAIGVAMPAIISDMSITVVETGKSDLQVVQGSLIATGWSLFNAVSAVGCIMSPLFLGLIRNAARWQTTVKIVASVVTK